MNCDVIAGSLGLPEWCCVAVPFACDLAVGVNRSHRNDLINGASPGPGAVTRLSRPDPASTMPVARLTPDFEPGYGGKVENTSGALRRWDGRVDENTFTWASVPGPEPTTMLSAMEFPSMSAPATATPPVTSAPNGANRVTSVLKSPSAVLLPS